ncbi:hypothetical protein BS47DRAFT_1368058 [Hydnum rufescens UP504]|uniref:Uncharacterized protein n=1 Tax=Hydnum rufescens UP504 TaxID=1448309 RepID=A0A9P6AIF5_9AGAM|nr:hypothetical protein BS47DRAFT_1368058 [Hydnum rufescens UP504]
MEQRQMKMREVAMHHLSGPMKHTPAAAGVCFYVRCVGLYKVITSTTGQTNPSPPLEIITHLANKSHKHDPPRNICQMKPGNGNIRHKTAGTPDEPHTCQSFHLKHNPDQPPIKIRDPAEQTHGNSNLPPNEICKLALVSSLPPFSQGVIVILAIIGISLIIIALILLGLSQWAMGWVVNQWQHWRPCQHLSSPRSPFLQHFGHLWSTQAYTALEVHTLRGIHMEVGA